MESNARFSYFPEDGIVPEDCFQFPEDHIVPDDDFQFNCMSNVQLSSSAKLNRLGSYQNRTFDNVCRKLFSESSNKSWEPPVPEPLVAEPPVPEPPNYVELESTPNYSSSFVNPEEFPRNIFKRTNGTIGIGRQIKEEIKSPFPVDR